MKHLRITQIYNRLRFQLYHPRPDTSAPPELRIKYGTWSSCNQSPRQLGPMEFKFIGRTHTIESPEDWNREDLPKLWLYNLHYFDDLTADGSERRTHWHRELIARWLQENPPGRGNGWEPYPLSLRLVNWIQWLAMGNDPVDGMIDSLAVQARWLSKRLETHLLGNHLWANLKALIFAGTAFKGPEADRWRNHALKLFRRELAEQILPDGGHFERSPMYHAITIADLLDLIQLDMRYPENLPPADVCKWRHTSDKMLRWLRIMSHPDGGIAFFNDAALDIAPDEGALRSYARNLGIPITHAELEPIENLSASGYVRLQNDRVVAILDLAPIGPDYLPGHAHADTLSFELSIRNQRVFVNGGTSTYAYGLQRRIERGTAIHNTVYVDGQDSSEVWASFRVGRRARVSNVFVENLDDGYLVEGSHDGYSRLPGRVYHRRRWIFSRSSIQVKDWLNGRFSNAQARFRLHPGLQVACDTPENGSIVGNEITINWRASGAIARVEAGEWHPEFGSSRDCEVLILETTEPSFEICFNWDK